MVFERFTPMARRVMMVAQESARRRRRQRIGTDDLLAALAEPNGTSSAQALERLGVTAADITQKLSRGRWRSSPSHIRLGEDTKRAIHAAMREADIRGEVQVGPSHLLLGLVAERHGDGGRIVSELDLSYNAVSGALEALPAPRTAIQQSEVDSGASDPETEPLTGSA